MDEATLQKNERTVVAAACVGHALCHVGLLIFPGILVVLRGEFNLSKSAATDIATLGYILLGVGAIPAGVITDRWSPKRMLLVYFLWMAAACGLLVIARSTASLIIGLTLIGAGASIYHPVGLTMISHGVRLRGRAMGIHGVAGSVGVSFGSALGMWMAALWSWRAAYALVGGVALLAAFVVSRSSLKEHVVDRTEAGGSSGKAYPDGHGSLVRMLPFLYAAMVCGGLSYRALVTALPSALLGSGATAADLRSGGWATFAVFAVGGAGQLLGGRLSDRLRPTWLYLFLILFSLPPTLALGLGLEGGQAAVAAVLAFFIFAVQPVENTILAKASPSRHRATLYGLKFAPAFGIGALATPVVGRIWKATDAFTGVFMLIAGLLTVMGSLALIVALYVRSSRRRSVEETES